MFMRMVYDEKLAQAAYLIGCQASGEAVVIDPERDVDRYIKLAEDNGLKLTATAETHIHADFISGSRELAEQVGVHVYVSDEGDADWKYHWLDQRIGGGSYEHTLLHDGDSFRIGKIEFRVIHTPGHTPEHIVFLVTDHGSGATEPIGMASGDFVFVGDLGRPDLLESAAGTVGIMEPSARTLYKTTKKLGSIPDFVQVWPAHGAGSVCGKALGAVPMSTIGYERRFNPALKAASSEQGFVDFILSGQPEPPVYFANMKRDNKVGPRVLGGLPNPRKMNASEFESFDTKQFALIDTRLWESFSVGHIPGSMSFPLTKAFNTNVGSMVCDTDEIYLIIAEDNLEEAIRDLIRIGLDRIVGWMEPSEIDSFGGNLASIKQVDALAASALIDRKEVEVLDVRRMSEFLCGHLPGAINIPHTRLAARLDELPQNARLLVHCQSGVRSSVSSAYLQRMGYEVVNMPGGYLAWHELVNNE